MISIVHRVSIPSPHTHLVHVETTLAGELPSDLVLFMPVWTPGSYLVREYARHVEGMSVEGGGVVRVRKNAWRVTRPGGGPVVVRYQVYANELTVRTSHVDDTHAFLVGAGLFLGVEGHLELPARVEITAPAGWRVATALPPAGNDAWLAADFDTLVDSPIEIGTHREDAFEVLGKPHRYCLWPPGAASDAEMQRLVEDTRTILTEEARLFGGALPYDRYDLLLHLTPRGRGGLEHRSSVALLASPAAFATRDAYLDLLSLVAHEAFHAWNVKRLRPEGLAPYRYEEECYTRQLWWFEGGTSYYDWRVLRRTRLCSVEEYLDHLADEIAYVDQTPGRLVHPLEEASFDAWVKLYRPDENSVNSTVSYYRKGELVCALLDLEIRGRSLGRASLDRVLAALWEKHGASEVPVPEGGLQRIFEEASGVALGDLFDAWIRSTRELDLGPTLARAGLQVQRSPRADALPTSLGARLRVEGGKTLVASVPRGGAAWRAGIDAGDELVAVGKVRAQGTDLEAALRGRVPGDEVEVTLARDGRIATRALTLDPARTDRVKLVASKDAAPEARALFTAWLGDPHPAWGTP